MTVIQQLTARFDPLDLTDLGPLMALYADDLLFEDPVHRIVGRPALRAYFARLNRNARAVRFAFDRVDELDDRAYLTWTLHATLRRPVKTLEVPGISVVKHDGERVVHQRDYFDASKLFFEPVPVLGGLVRGAKRLIGG